MANQSPFQLKRGDLEKVQQYVPAVGEPVYSLDTNQLYVGDGATSGGILVGSGTNLDFGPISQP
jgi:hypothetical protein